MPEDDDVNFTMLARLLIEQRGDALTASEVAESWLANPPAGRVFTAERAVYRRLLNSVPVERVAEVRFTMTARAKSTADR